jgi:hypothetical protein
MKPGFNRLEAFPDSVESRFQPVDASGEAGKIAMQTGDFRMQIGDFHLQSADTLRQHFQTFSRTVNGAPNVTQVF